MRFWKRDAPEEGVETEVHDSAAPLLAKLEKVREEDQRVAAQTEQARAALLVLRKQSERLRMRYDT